MEGRKTMLFSEWIRREVFWAWDFLRGSKVRKHYVDIKNILENGTNPEVVKIREGYLSDILKYATEHVPFYKEYRSYDSIKSFPVINKIIVRDHYDAFQSPEFLKAPVVHMHTGGSTGVVIVVRQDKNKRKRVFAEMIYFWGKAGYQIGMKYVFFRIWAASNRKSKLSAWARNMLMMDIRRLDDKNLENIRTAIKADHKIRMLLGYPNTFEELANYMLTCGDTPEMYKINTIIGIGEALTTSTFDKLKKVFNCNIVSLYSNQENGMLAQECAENKEFHVNNASYYIELLKIDSDDPASVGEPGRILVTDLFNHAMPLIRYDTGDIGGWKKEADCGWESQVLSSIQGRMVDSIFDTQGNRVSPHNIGMLMLPFDKLLQYQFIQEGERQYTLKLNGAKGLYAQAAFTAVFKAFLGQDAEITIEYVDEIPVLASGKRKKVVSHYVKVD
jgi:phenylacetate-CoA ligase